MLKGTLSSCGLVRSMVYELVGGAQSCKGNIYIYIYVYVYIYTYVIVYIYIHIDGGSIVEGWVQGSAFRSGPRLGPTVSIAED